MKGVVIGKSVTHALEQMTEQIRFLGYEPKAQGTIKNITAEIWLYDWEGTPCNFTN